MIPHVCPVCLGKKIVPGGFYNAHPGCCSISCDVSEPCRTCVNGIVWENETKLHFNCSTQSFTTSQNSQTVGLTIDNVTERSSILGSINIVLNKILKHLKGREKHV